MENLQRPLIEEIKVNYNDKVKLKLDKTKIQETDPETLEEDIKLLKNDKYSLTKQLSDRSDYLCLGYRLLNDAIFSQLKCYYLETKLKPSIRLMRIKVKEL